MALLRRKEALLLQYRTTTGTQLGRTWRSLGTWADEDRWVELAAPVLAAAQERAINLQAAYLEAILNDRLTFDPAAVLDRAAIDIAQPFVALANALDTGANLEAAVEAGAARAVGIGESGVSWAARAANETVADERIVGWTRVLDGNACEWCQLVSTQRYHSAESASFGHLRCGCGVDPIIGDRDPGRVINGELLASIKS